MNGVTGLSAGANQCSKILLSTKRLETNYLTDSLLQLAVNWVSISPSWAESDWLFSDRSAMMISLPPPSAVVIVSRQSHSHSLDSSDQLRLARGVLLSISN